MTTPTRRPSAQPHDLSFDALLDRVEACLDEKLIPVEIFNDEQTFHAEMERIFTRTWVFVAHESEIPNPGDFVQRRIGLDPVIVTRDGKGGINVLSNYCRHRGTQVCQTDSGNSRFFKCPYHGWTYNNEGQLVGTPMMHQAYGERLDPNDWSLLRAPRVDTRQGFIFASLSANVPSLDEYLGGAGWMLDLIVGLHPDGMRVAGPPDRYKVKANWKSAAENFAGDVYHVPNLHWSTEEIKVSQGLQGTCEIGRTYEFENGHNFMGHAWTEAIHPGFVAWGYPPEFLEEFDLDQLDEAQRFVVDHQPPTVGTIFPNLSFIRFLTPSTPGGPASVVTSFRQFQPIGPGEMELWSWQFVWTFQDGESALQDYTTGQFVFGSAGIFEQDDTVAWEGIQRAGASPWARKEAMTLHFQMGLKSPVDQSPDPNWKGPGIHRNTGYGEHTQMNFYRQWVRVMKDDTTTQEGDRP
ncbi:MAG: aromatic ring-hydroxylating dioxygenase subunit alpha [Intrasporangium sp.]|uniref:aromatic ring-hydroxylating oxygenase subunit alpha n=1 Tax=Intrasporangium sp. TaxID=1925024 RepID=UPI002647CCA5|nr:aromatic ring-hydroxylating dioxygenase subunit alpha [Intrasporangium sp.]MDN5796412.1 aromatic ring-hydroxylating dioxygenase subunit alpha [Intrasporangium sp.]